MAEELARYQIVFTGDASGVRAAAAQAEAAASGAARNITQNVKHETEGLAESALGATTKLHHATRELERGLLSLTAAVAIAIEAFEVGKQLREGVDSDVRGEETAKEALNKSLDEQLKIYKEKGEKIREQISSLQEKEYQGFTKTAANALTLGVYATARLASLKVEEEATQAVTNSLINQARAIDRLKEKEKERVKIAKEQSQANAEEIARTEEVLQRRREEREASIEYYDTLREISEKREREEAEARERRKQAEVDVLRVLADANTRFYREVATQQQRLFDSFRQQSDQALQSIEASVNRIPDLIEGLGTQVIQR